VCIHDPWCRNFESFVIDKLAPIDDWTVEDNLSVAAMFIFFMSFDFEQEVQRSFFDASFKDSKDLHDFAEQLLIMDDGKTRIGL
jgi:hypothetical protein